MNASASEWLTQIASVLETLNQGVIIDDDERKIVFANAMFLEMIGKSADEIVGRGVDQLFPLEDVPSLLEQIQRRRSHGRNQFEFYLPRAQGERLPVVVTSRQISGPDGRPYAVVTVTDISEQKRVQAALTVANSALEARQRELEKDLQLAADVQQSLAPKALTWGRISVETFYQPVKTIGGDFGLVAQDGDHLNMLVCDISGHGIGSALVANRVYMETTSQIAVQSRLDPMLRHLNRFAMQTLGSSAFYFTVAALRLDNDGRLEFAGAGHPPAMVVEPGKSIRFLESNSSVLGVFEDAIGEQPAIEAHLQPGARVVIYTDGLTESFDSQERMLGTNGLAEIVHQVASLPLPAMKQAILDRVAAWRSGPAVDDVSLVIAEVS